MRKRLGVFLSWYGYIPVHVTANGTFILDGCFQCTSSHTIATVLLEVGHPCRKTVSDSWLHLWKRASTTHSLEMRCSVSYLKPWVSQMPEMTVSWSPLPQLTLMQTAVICHPRILTTKQEFIPEGACYCPLPAGQWHRGSDKEEEKLTKRTVAFLPWGI